MNQTQLFSTEDIGTHNIQTPSISAGIKELQDEVYEVTLNISSNKFLIVIKQRAGIIESFEIVAVKSFVTLTKKTINLLKEVVQQLFMRDNYNTTQNA
jgi:hypothetical protein